MELQQEYIAQTGLNRYRRAVIDGFEGDMDSLSLLQIRRELDEHLAYSRPALIDVQFTEEALDYATSLTSLHEKWHDPVTAERFEDARYRRQQIDKGDLFGDVGVTNPFYAPLLDLAVVFDATPELTDEGGELYAEGLRVDAVTHEDTHARISGNNTRRELWWAEEDNAVVIRTIKWNGAICDTKLPPEQVTAPAESSGIWLEEAFAMHLATKVRQKLHPETIPTNGGQYAFSEYGIDKAYIPAHHLVVAGPRNQGHAFTACVATADLEKLEAKRHGVISNFTQMANGRVAGGRLYPS